MNGILLLNKEKNMTSHDLVNIVRRQLKIKRVGHTGTLDPNATGLMMVAYGKSTKLVSYLQKDHKEYIFEMELGVLTDTLDVWGQVIQTKSYTKPTKKQIEQVLDSFIGKQQQDTPMYSAVKVQGKRLHELARQNITIKTPVRDIEIYELELLEYNDNIKARVVCSSGTYVRSLCLDVAKKLGTIGIMTSLVRTKIGEFTLNEANTIAELKNNQYNVIDVERVLSDYPIVDYDNISDILNGRRIKLNIEEPLVFIKIKEDIMAVYELVENNIYKSKRGLW